MSNVYFGTESISSLKVKCAVLSVVDNSYPVSLSNLARLRNSKNDL